MAWSKSSKSLSAGVAKGLKAGHLGVWVLFDKATANEAFRVRVRTESADYHGKVVPFTYTFAPAYDRSFVRSLETPFDFREFLVGTRRAKTGKVIFEVIVSGPERLTLTYDLPEILKLFRLKGKEAPSSALRTDRFAMVDPAEIAAIPDDGLKAYSDKIRAELEEKRKKEEEEKKKKEAEAAAAAAAKAAADKAAAASKGKPAPAAGAAPSGPLPPTLSPAKVGIFYGTSTGNTEDIANRIKAALGDVDHIKNITEIVPADLTVCENMILGVPTWHIGEMQDDWALVLPALDSLNFAGKKIAIFGLGDQKGYPDTYVDAMGELLEKFEKTGAKLYGLWPTEGYNFTGSKGMRDGKFMGLVIDIENQANMSDARIATWVKQIKSEMGI